MEEVRRKNRKREKKVPRVPIKTYKWEDVRRDRRKGGYPWTYLTKPPFNEFENPENYMMDTLRKSKSESTVDQTDTLNITEITNGSNDEASSTEPIVSEAQTPEPQMENLERQDRLTLESADSSDNISQYLDKEEPNEQNVDVPGPSSSEPEKLSPESDMSTLQTNGRKERAKSEEPKRKRKLSLESSYSRVSLSKLGFLKKLKDAKKKIKIPKLSLSKTNLTKILPKSTSKSQPTPSKKEITKEVTKEVTNGTPVYIHIPLKPPPGTTDEFSHFEFEEKENVPPKAKDVETISSPSTPETPKTDQNDSVQLIILTAPSDDEILDEAPIPETPSETQKTIDNKKVEELKTLAKDAVGGAAADKSNTETVMEKNKEDKDITKTEETKHEEKMLVDEEDGLKSNKTAETIEEDQQKESTESEITTKKTKKKLKKVKESIQPDETIEQKTEEPTVTLEIPEPSDEIKKEEVKIAAEETKISDDTTNIEAEKTKKDSFKKKVSFKRKKSDDKNGDYEDIEKEKPTEVDTEKAEEAKRKLAALGTSESMSADEEKSYLDQKIIKSTSLDDDYNKWSKLRSQLRLKNLDKDGQGRAKGMASSAENLRVPLSNVAEEPDRTERAKSEEPKRKRKLSLESSHSGLSLSKAGFLKKIKDVKDKVKIPKISFSKINPKNIKLKQEFKAEKLPEKQEVKKEAKKETKIETPVYIHIPLKPPPGETDEFSHLEFEEKEKEKKPEAVETIEEKAPESEPESPEPEQDNRVQLIILTAPSDDELLDTATIPETPSESGHFFDDTKVEELKTIAKEVIDEAHPTTHKLETVRESPAKEEEINGNQLDEVKLVKSETEMVVDIEDGLKVSEPASSKVETQESETKTATTTKKTKKKGKKLKESKTEEKLVEEVQPVAEAITTVLDSSAEKLSKELQKELQQVNESVETDIEKLKKDDGEKEKDTAEVQPIKPAEIKEEIPIEEMKTAGNEEDLEESAKIRSQQQTENVDEKEQIKKLASEVQNLDSNTGQATSSIERKERAKSEEPKRKRKLSTESNHSRVSLSKLGFLKKIKDATDKVKLPKISFSKLNPKNIKFIEDFKMEKKPVKKEEVKQVASKEVKKDTIDEKPVYIHIPLKPPPGKTDEFSHLEFEDRSSKLLTSKTEEKTLENVLEESKEEEDKRVQLILLTAPSEEEVLDDIPIPETPLESNKLLDEEKIEELKTLAKEVVDEVTPDKSKINKTDARVDQQTDEKKTSAIDAEDGLKLNEEQSSKVELKNVETKDETATKKTKRKVKKLKDIQKPSEENLPTISEKDISKEIPEDKVKDSILAEKTSKDTKKDGDYEEIQGAKMAISKKEEKEVSDTQKESIQDKEVVSTETSDHEYEPINPPPEEVTHTSPPMLRVNDTSLVGSTMSSTTSLDRRLLGTPQEDEPHMSTDVVIQDSVKDVQDRMDDRFLNATPETISSRTDEVHTSQVDSSAIENLPLQRESRKRVKTRTEGPGKLQKYLRDQSGKFKTKLQGIKRPHITMPQRPKFDKFKFERPKIHLPKMPDRSKLTLPKLPDAPKINFPTFSLPRKGSASKRSLRERQFSTESNAGDSKKNIFDFRTYPRIFKKKQKPENESSGSSQPEFATVPRTYKTKGMNDNGKDSRKPKDSDKWDGRDSIRIPLHSQTSMDKENLDFRSQEASEENNEERETSVERRMASHIRYNKDIDIDDAYERENLEINRASPFSHDYNPRWKHGTFHGGPQQEYIDDNSREEGYRITDLDMPEPQTPPEEVDINTSKETHSSGSSLEPQHRRGVLEEINSDEFFLRQKGISQDNIDVGMYLSSEIREAFKSPQNALSQLQDDNFYAREYGSEQSLPEVTPRRRPKKKPKRKKTPHVSQEIINYDQESITEPEEYPKPVEEIPLRPTRKGKQSKQKEDEDVIPYQEIIPVESVDSQILKTNILSDDGFDQAEFQRMYENEQMKGIEQPEIEITESYRFEEFESKFRNLEEIPTAPPRKNRSIKSLDASEHDSIIEEINFGKELPERNIEAYRAEHEYIIPTPEEPPLRPTRTRSQSRTTSQPDDDRTSRGAESLISEGQIACVEEPCLKDTRDLMGYAIIDKQKVRDPPLPPQRNRSIKSEKSETKFFTVPRPLNDAPPPTRPLRNYSTLGPSRPPRKKSIPNLTDEEKENIDITQYIEIEDETCRNLHSGEVIQKMRDRPLPAPPRPPRKTRALRDITQDDNVQSTRDLSDEKTLEETEVSTQTEPVPEDFICEDIMQNIEDQIIIPEAKEETQNITVEQHIITPTHYTHEETITHASLLIEPLDGARILPDSQLIRQERIVPVTREPDYDDETSEIPEDFKKLKDPEPKKEEKPQVIERIIERQVPMQLDPNTEVEILKAQKLQVGDLDVDRLTVNELLANKITVSEIDGVNIQVNEISSKSGALKVGEIELPPNLVQELFEKLQSVAQAQSSEVQEEGTSKEQTSVNLEQKKTPIDEIDVNVSYDEPPQRPPRQVDTIKTPDKPPPCVDSPKEIEEEANIIEDISCIERRNSLKTEESIEPPPQRPPRQLDTSKTEQTEQNEEKLQLQDDLEDLLKDEEILLIEALRGRIENVEEPPQRPPRHSISGASQPERMQEPEVDDGPPPRPPQPVYIPSQPPPSFYALRAQKYSDYFEDDIPMPPRRKRHPKIPVSRSSSEETPPAPVARRRPKTPEPTIPQLTSQLLRACGNVADRSLKRLIIYITNNVLNNADGRQDMHVIIVILLVLIAGLILIGFGDGKTVHHHHWEFFNPPKNM